MKGRSLARMDVHSIVILVSSRGGTDVYICGFRWIPIKFNRGNRTEVSLGDRTSKTDKFELQVSASLLGVGAFAVRSDESIRELTCSSELFDCGVTHVRLSCAGKVRAICHQDHGKPLNEAASGKRFHLIKSSFGLNASEIRRYCLTKLSSRAFASAG